MPGEAAWSANGCSTSAYDGAFFKSAPTCSLEQPSRAWLEVVQGLTSVRTLHLEPVLPVSGADVDHTFHRVMCIDNDPPARIRAGRQRQYATADAVAALETVAAPCVLEEADAACATAGAAKGSVLFSSRPIDLMQCASRKGSFSRNTCGYGIAGEEGSRVVAPPRRPARAHRARAGTTTPI